MEKNWVKIYSSDQIHFIRIMKALLEEEDIESVEMDKQDSSYTVLGEYELYVQQKDVLRAKYLLEKKTE